jgi:hypothetical protein
MGKITVVVGAFLEPRFVQINSDVKMKYRGFLNMEKYQQMSRIITKSEHSGAEILIRREKKQFINISAPNCQ